jgi:flagellar biosynthesis protein FlhF
MIYKSYKAPTYKDAVLQAKMDLGNDFYIIGRKEAKEGGFLGLFSKTFTEITVAKNEEDRGCSPGRGPKVAAPKSVEAAQRKTSYAVAASAAPQSALPPSAVPMSSSAPASLQTNPWAVPSRAGATFTAAGPQTLFGNRPAVSPQGGVQAPDHAGAVHAGGSDHQVPAQAFAEASIVRELQEIKKRLDDLGEPGGRSKSPHLDRLVRGLRENDFAEDFIEKLRSRLETELTLKEASDPKLLEERMKAHMLESIETSGPIQAGKGKPTIVVLVGPTGVGKTTTIAKLAASYGIMQKQKVEIFTIDSYRIAAIEQLGKYAELMQLPFTVINTREEFKNAVQHSKAELIFVDTAGRSQKNSLGLAELRSVLDGVRAGLDVHLVVSATTKYRDALDIFTRFNQLMYNKVIITKIDEATTIGPLMSALSKDRQVSYLTNGQSVPDDIELAAKEKLLNMVIIDEFNAG